MLILSPVFMTSLHFPDFLPEKELTTLPQYVHFSQYLIAAEYEASFPLPLPKLS